jgi:hypothetical protein
MREYLRGDSKQRNTFAHRIAYREVPLAIRARTITSTGMNSLFLEDS